MNSGNPTLNPNTFRDVTVAQGPPMTLSGTTSKAFLLFCLVIVGTAFTWHSGPMSQLLMVGGGIGGFILALVTVFKKQWAPVTAPLYALLEGLFLGGISAMYNARMEGIVLQAVMLTFGVMAAMLFLYQSRIIRVTPGFVKGLMAATLGIVIFYGASLLLSFFGINALTNALNDSSAWGIGLSIFIVCIAALNLVLDFAMIEAGTATGAPKYMEWYCSFALMVTLIWLYLEILRLLAKSSRR
jgi:uncharacterized YccA/Bax inhibitor family protein